MKLNFNRDGKTYTIRPARMADADAVAEMINLCSQILFNRNEIDTRELSNDWAIEGFDLDKDSLMVWEGEHLVAYGDLWGTVAPYVRHVPLIRVHPDYRGLGFGWLLNVWSETRARELMEQSPEGTRVFLANYVNTRDQAATQLLTDFGAQIERYTWQMERGITGDIEKPLLAGGYSLRVIEKGAYEQIYRLQRECFRDHWGMIESPFEEGYRHFISEYVEEAFYNPDLWLGVEHQGEWVGYIIGCSSSSFGEEFGWIPSLGVLREHRKSGLGKALLLHSFRAIKDFGSTQVGLSVDSQSLTGATSLYESVGMIKTEEYIRFEKTIREGRDLRKMELCD